MKKIVLRILKYCTVGLVIMSVALAVFFSMKKMADISVRKVNDEYYGKILENLEIKAWEKYREGEDKKEYIKSQICKSMADLFYDSSYTVFVCDVIRDLNDETGEIKLIADSESLMCENIVNDALINFCMDSWLTKDEEAEMMEKYNNQTDDLIYKEIYGVKHFTDNEQWVVDKITKVVLWNEAEVEFTVDHGREDNEECLYNAEKNLYKTLDNTNINKYSVFRNNRENYNVFTDIIVPGGINQFVEYENDDVFINANREYMALAVSNYISNAVKYSENDGTIVISLTDNEFSVENSCENIYFIKYKSIWDIMTVNDKSRNRSKGSSGMGLPITAEICRINGIKYGATERNGRAYFFMKF